MKQKATLITALVLGISAAFPNDAQAQTTTTSTSGTTTTGNVSNTTTSSSGTTATAATGTGTATVAPTSPSEPKYLSRIAPRYEKLAGSSSNLESLVHGLRTGSEVRLTSGSAPSGPSTTSSGANTTTSTSATTGTAGASGTSAVTFTPTTRPMGYGSITRTLDLASKQLAAAGITNPTPQDLQAALNGGTVKTAQGSTTFQGVLKLRAEGMGWGKIAHTIGVHPGMGKSMSHASGTQSTTGSVSTAAGTTQSSQKTSTATQNASSGKGSVTSAGAGSQSSGKGIVTAGGAASPHSHGGGKVASHVQPSSGVVTASGAAAGSGVTSAGGNGRGNAYGHGGKN